MTLMVIIFCIALACALAVTPMARGLARRLGFLDYPATCKLHNAPVPLLGGAAIYVAVLLSMAAVDRHGLQDLTSILVAATAMFLLGLWDDRSRIPPFAKLAVQVLIAGAVMLSGVRVALAWLPGWMNIALSLLWIVGITNALNLLDNMDGLSAGVAAVACACFAVIASMTGQNAIAALSLAVLGGCVGFLFYNIRPAAIFMGDAGSLFLGMTLALIGIQLRFPDNHSSVTWMVPVLVLGVPVFDVALVVISRLRRGVNPLTTAGKDHTSHRLAAAGRTRLEVMLLHYLAGCCCGLVAIFVMRATVAQSFSAGCAVLAVGGWLMWRLEWSGCRE